HASPIPELAPVISTVLIIECFKVDVYIYFFSLFDTLINGTKAKCLRTDMGRLKAGLLGNSRKTFAIGKVCNRLRQIRIGTGVFRYQPAESGRQFMEIEMIKLLNRESRGIGKL